MTWQFHTQHYNIKITGEGKTYSFLLTGLPPGVTAQLQFKHGETWFPHPDMDYTPQDGVISGKFTTACVTMRFALSAPPTEEDEIMLSIAETTTARF